MLDLNDHVCETQPQLPLLSRWTAGSQAYGLVGLFKVIGRVRRWKSYFLPRNMPDLIKSYDTRPNLPIRIFIPTAAKSSTANIPTLFTIHGGGFTLGLPEEDDKWNRTFADTHNVLIVALNYSKAPFHPFPAAINDLEALIAVILADPAIPINKHQCAVAGFSAGGNLALAVAQLDGVKSAFEQHGKSTGFKAVVPIYPALDRTVTRDYKATQRRYKPNLSRKRNSSTDFLQNTGKAFDWSYIPVGQNLRDPLVSPIFTPREKLPPFVFVVACELDLSSHDAWRMACRLAGRREPAMDEKSGREECGTAGELELVDERFAWEDEERGIRWLLIPDAFHAFDHLGSFMLGDETSVRDAELKSSKLIREIGDWLKMRAWQQ